MTSVQITLGRTGQPSCDSKLRTNPWDIDRTPGYGPGASAADAVPGSAPRQGEIPAEYRTASDAELRERIHNAKATLGKRAVVLGHFYQRDEIVEHADYVGDSFQLANAALEHPDADAIVFCGVHFMAETADILSGPDQAVILPNLAAGCSMADMANEDDVEACWEQLTELFGTAPDADGRVPVIPVTYMNCSAALKGFVGAHGGYVCTSSNAATVLERAFADGQRVLFFPDQHLGRNTALAMGIGVEQMPLWKPRQALGGNTEARLHDARVILWNGFCSVHRRFTVDQIDQARAQYPDATVVVHPECPLPVVQAADISGSTDVIRRVVESAEPGAVIAIGTEINLVNRLAAQHPDKTIFCLDPVVCPCSTMYRIHPGYLAWVLESLVAGQVVNRIRVPEAVAADAKVALDRMLAAKPK